MPRRMAIDFTKLCALIILGTVCYNEYLSYYMSYLSWPRIPDPGSDGAVLLLVADPQILGRAQEPPGILGAVRRWDSDRFLHKSYSWAMYGYVTSGSLFLGDLINEASVTSDKEIYKEYVGRFHDIFPRYSESHHMIYLPGDNDIGGEGGDKVTLHKIDMFETYFGPTQLVHSLTDKVVVVPVSRLTEHNKYNLTMKTDKIGQDKIVLAVSHVPVLPLNGRFSERVVDLINPDVVFSAHDHHGYLFTADRQTRKMVRAIEKFSKQEDSVPFTLQTREKHKTSPLTWEVVVPTCSYRMGVQDVGMGLVVVRGDGQVYYTNLWLPGRFSLLYTYLASVLVVVTIVLVRKGVDLLKFFRRRCINHRDKFQH